MDFAAINHGSEVGAHARFPQVARLSTGPDRIARAGRVEHSRLGVGGATARGSGGVADPAGGPRDPRPPAAPGLLAVRSAGALAWEPVGGAGALSDRELAAGVAAQSGGVGVVGLERRAGAGLAAPGAVGLVVVAGRWGRVAWLAPAGGLGLGRRGVMAGAAAGVDRLSRVGGEPTAPGGWDVVGPGAGVLGRPAGCAPQRRRMRRRSRWSSRRTAAMPPRCLGASR